MCGIAALFGEPSAERTQHILAMTGVVRHRGPDDEGYALIDLHAGAASCYAGADTPRSVLGRNSPYAPKKSLPSVASHPAAVALGHRRLSIVDLTPSGHQPMCDPGAAIWIVYNGEIYNHKELRAELEAQGAVFSSTSDTEVIIQAWRLWGRRCLDRFNGMFAFVLVDLTQRTVFVARDRFGVKPLYWWRSPSGFLAFASEIKQFCVLPGWSARLDGQAAYDYLNWGIFDHGSGTLFAGVRQLRGGECVEFGLDAVPRELAPVRWYAPRPAATTLPVGGEISAFRDLLHDAVRLRLRADVGVGSCLSGGLDSSSIVCIAHRLLREAHADHRQSTFSAISDVPQFDEREYAEAVVAATDVDAHFIQPDLDGLQRVLAKLIWHQDEPFGSSSIFAQWSVFHAAADHGVKVMLDGQGADEILAGYTGFIGPYLANRIRALQWGDAFVEARALAQFGGRGMGFVIKQGADALLPEILRQPLRRFAGVQATEPTWLDVNHLGALDRDPNATAGNEDDAMLQLSTSLLTRTGLPMLLHTEDRNSMAHSVESRVPFLDYRLVEMALGLPDAFKIAGGLHKRILRDALTGILPDKVRERRSKLGFATPEEVWMRQQNPALFRTWVREAVAASQGVIKPQAIEACNHRLDGRRPFDFLVWRIINFGLWMRSFDVRHL